MPTQPSPAQPPVVRRDSGSQTVATVERAADVLVLFTESDSPTLGVTEIAENLGTSKAAVHRILASLRSRHLVHLDEESHRYSLGTTAMRLGAAYQERVDVRQIAAADLRALSRLTGETTTLSVRTGDARVYIDQVTPQREVIMAVSLGIRYPLHAGSSSKAFLAFLPEDEREAYLEREPLGSLTGETMVDVYELRRELDRIRTAGYATSFGERQAGAASTAAPLLDHRGEPVAVISVCGPRERFLEEADACSRALLETTRRLSERLGARA
ncbi:IclR family transcriptional regulator [Nocardiopsis quinghaiensis]|uniref:IclR family transcriptional regulator n=1 Tax=Nocardiopsis quinghaiensis TaxID=464995 RepID=UPI00123944B1|nr:IclR family transcriptional regulator [Nocardiopsis quinghaiensis]